MRFVFTFIGGFSLERDVFGLILHLRAACVIVHVFLSVFVLICCSALEFGVIRSVPDFLVWLLDLDGCRDVVLLILGLVLEPSSIGSIVVGGFLRSFT